MRDVLKVDIASEADIFILEYKLKKFMQRHNINLLSVPLVARELATNVLKYGGRGFVEFVLERDKVVILAEDSGKNSGSNSEREKKRGLGIGLQIVRNSSDELEIARKEDGGTRIKANFLLSPGKRKNFLLQLGIASKPHYLEEESGDICFHEEINGRHFLFVADVLGHGSKAREVAGLIESYLKRAKDVSIRNVYAGLERLLKGTRGCAAFAACISREGMEYLNIGNVRGWLLFFDGVKKLKEVPGVVGRMSVKANVFKEPISLLSCTLLVCTDGIKRQFIPGPEMTWIRTFDPQGVAEKILTDFGLKEDDATVVVARGG